MEKSREMKIREGGGGYGKTPRDEKPRGFLVMGEPTLFDTKRSVFHKGISFHSICLFLDMEFLEVLTEGLERVLMVRGGGREVITIYS